MWCEVTEKVFKDFINLPNLENKKDNFKGALVNYYFITEKLAFSVKTTKREQFYIKTTIKSMEKIYQRLTNVFGEENIDWLKKNLLPDWWDDDLAEDIVTKRIAELTLTKALNLPLDIFLVEDDGEAIKKHLESREDGVKDFWDLLAKSIDKKLNFNILKNGAKK